MHQSKLFLQSTNIYIPVALALLLLSTTKALTYPSSDTLEIAGISFLILVSCLIGISATIRINELTRVAVILSVILVSTNAIQIFLLLIFSRYPALAYPNTSNIRFGSLLDDPNGYAYLCSLLIPSVWFGVKKKFLRFTLVALLCISLLSTQSWSGIFFFLFTFLIFISFKYWRKNLYSKILISVSVVITLSVPFLLLFTPMGQQLAGKKMESILIHLDSFTSISELTWPVLFGLDTSTEIIESGYLRMLEIEGLLYTLIFIAISVWSISVFYLASTNTNIDQKYRDFAKVLLFFQLSFMFGMLFLPLHVIAPVNIVFALSLGLSVSVFVSNLANKRRIQDDRSQGQTDSKLKPMPTLTI